MWRGPELKPIWTHVESRIKEFQGQALQPTGIWEKDYDVLLEELVKVEKTKELERQQEEEDAERAKVQSSEGEWEAVVERFNQRNVSGVRLIKGQNPLSLAVALAKAGMLLLLEGVKEPDVAGVAEWQVSSKAPQGRSPTKLENSILECLNSRPRKWDLAYLLVRFYCEGRTSWIVNADNSSQGHDLVIRGYQADRMRSMQPINQQRRSATDHPPSSTNSSSPGRAAHIYIRRITCQLRLSSISTIRSTFNSQKIHMKEMNLKERQFNPQTPHQLRSSCAP